MKVLDEAVFNYKHKKNYKTIKQHAATSTTRFPNTKQEKEKYWKIYPPSRPCKKCGGDHWIQACPEKEDSKRDFKESVKINEKKTDFKDVQRIANVAMSRRSYTELHPCQRQVIEDSDNEEDRQENIHAYIGILQNKNDEYTNKLNMPFMNKKTNQSTNFNNKKLVEDTKKLSENFQHDSDKNERERTTSTTRESRQQKDKFPSCFNCCDYNHSDDEQFFRCNMFM
jgi:hypothetical protein